MNYAQIQALSPYIMKLAIYLHPALKQWHPFNPNLRSFEFLCCRNFLYHQWFPQLFAQHSTIHSWFAYEGIRSKKFAASCRNCSCKWTQKSFWNCSKRRHVGLKFIVPSLSLFSSLGRRREGRRAEDRRACYLEIHVGNSFQIVNDFPHTRQYCKVIPF